MMYHQKIDLTDMPVKRILMRLKYFTDAHNENIKLLAAIGGAKVR